MKIIRLNIDNFMRLSAVDIHSDGTTITVAGKNGAGKTSVLSAIEAALGGAKHSPEDPIRHGEKTARVIVQTPDLVVTRKWTPKGSQLEVKAQNGGLHASPQALLDSLVGPISFDPIAFARKDPQEQAAILRGLVGLDFAADDAKRQEAYDKRTDVGRELRRLNGALEKLPEVSDDTPEFEISVTALAAEMERRQQVNASNAESRHELDNLRQHALALSGEIEKLEERLSNAKAKLDQITETGKALSARVSGLADEDLAEIREQIASADKTNRAIRTRIERDKLQGELDALITESEELTATIDGIDRAKIEAAAKAKYPIDGLAVTDTGVTLNGIPFGQASSAEQLRASVAIGFALNPKLKVLLVRDGSLLDAKSLAEVARMAEQAGGQVWIERVSESGDGCSVLIEDGHVAGTEQPKAEHRQARRAMREPGEEG